MIEYKKMIVVDKVLKITLCLMLVFIFTVMKPKQEAEAAVPILGWVTGVLGGLVIDVAINQGVTFVNKQAEKDFKNQIVNKVWNNYSTEIANLKPTKLDALKWAFKAPKWLMLVIVDAVDDVIQSTKKQAVEKEKYMSEWGGGSSSGGGAGRKFGSDDTGVVKEYEVEQPIDLPVNSPYYKTDLNIIFYPPDESSSATLIESYNYFLKYVKITYKPIAFEQKRLLTVCITPRCENITLTKPYVALYSDSIFALRYFESDTPINLKDATWIYASGNPLTGMFPAWAAYKGLLSEKGKKVVEFNNLIVYEELPRVSIDLPDYVELPRLEKLPIPNINYENKIIEFEMPPNILPQFELLPKNSDFEWSLIEDYIVEQGDNFYIVNYNMDYKPIINNYYSLPPAVIEEVEGDIGELIPVDKDKPNELDGSFNQYIKNFYNYFADGIITSIDGFKQLNSSVNSIFSVFGNYFTFLPIEFRTLFFSGASMSVLLGVLYWGRR